MSFERHHANRNVDRNLAKLAICAASMSTPVYRRLSSSLRVLGELGGEVLHLA